MASVKISQDAYTTIILHCAKHPASAVVGILVGATEGSDQTNVRRAIPLQHHWTQLSPMVEVGLGLIDASLSSSQSKGEQIVGVYYAPSDVASSQKQDLQPTPAKIAQTIASKNGSAVALQVNNARLGDDSNHALFAFKVAGTQVKQIQPNGISLESSNVVSNAKSAVANGKWANVVDFDDHLEDTNLNWLSATPLAA